MHSLPSMDKWNKDFPEVVNTINQTHKDRVAWDFMGMPRHLAAKMRSDNVCVRKEFSLPVRDFLAGVDVFLFFVSWNREEAWARSVAEAMTTGCPIITTGKGGNRDQVIHGNTGFLCEDIEDVIENCISLIENAKLLAAMRSNAMRFSRQFTSDSVARRFLEFIQ